ncbi:MAG: PhoH family protein [Lentisphaeria bacterium]|nr:PhoH family protein [Lentisphaeria bacterium]
MKKTYVLDTNVILHSAQSLNSFEDNEVVIPMTVIEELDKFKRNQDELGRNTRQAIRQIDALRQKGSLAKGVPLDNSSDPDKCGSLRVIVSEGRLSDSSDMHVPDNRILNVAKMLMDQKKRPVIFITKDLNLRLKADALGIPVEDFECEQVNSDELYSGVLTLPCDADLMTQFHRDGFIEIPKDLTVYPNEFVLFSDTANEHHTTVGWCRHGRIEVLPDGAGEHVGGITPRSLEQRMALILLTDPDIQVVSLVGQAGSGKTLLALAAAVEQAINNNLYERILVSRPIVPMGKDIGYMPGGKDEKLGVWMQPIYDNLEFLLQNGGKKDQQTVRRRLDDMRRNHQLELEALTYIRGRSIPNQFIIVDEAQNLTPHEVKTIVSRAGMGSKMILTGDPAQIDNPYLDASSNGLSYLVEHLKSIDLHGHITLRKSERSPLAAAAAEHL